MAFEKLQSDDPDALRRMQAMFGPQQVDQQVRQAIQFCWMALPPEKQNVDAVEREIRRIVDRAIRDMREDSERFRSGGG